MNIHALLPFPVNGAVFGGANRYLATKDFQTMLIKTQNPHQDSEIQRPL